jgi:hypothetical protein
MRFVYLGPELCLQLPSHKPLRRRIWCKGAHQGDVMTCGPAIECSCCSARSSCHQGLQRTFTSKSLPGSVSLTGSQATCTMHVASRHARRTDRGTLAFRGHDGERPWPRALPADGGRARRRRRDRVKKCPGAGPGHLLVVYWRDDYSRTTRVTRRFCARPALVELSAIGLYSPYDVEFIRNRGSPASMLR